MMIWIWREVWYGVVYQHRKGTTANDGERLGLDVQRSDCFFVFVLFVLLIFALFFTNTRLLLLLVLLLGNE